MSQPEEKVYQDVQTIRNILFGEQLQDMTARINDLEKEVVNLKKANTELRKLIDSNETSQGNVNKKAATDRSNLSKSISQLRRDISKRFEEEKLKSSELIEILAQSLIAYNSGKDSSDE